MGTDIHFYVERRETAESPWTWVDEPREHPVYGYTTVDHYYSDRSYDTFAILADVRNGRGFAGIKTGEGFVPVSPPRGLPTDMSRELSDYLAHELEHTPSWLTLAELLAFDWTQESKKQGVVDVAQWYRWRTRGKPEEWCGETWGQGLVNLDSAVVEAAFKSRFGDERWLAPEQVSEFDSSLCTAHAASRVVTTVQWGVKYYEAAAGLWSSTIPRMLRLGSPENVRCVFHFDS